jgi:hypothetical protein
MSKITAAVISKQGDAAMQAARRHLFLALVALLVPVVEGRQRGDRPGELRLVSRPSDGHSPRCMAELHDTCAAHPSHASRGSHCFGGWAENLDRGNVGSAWGTT